MFAEVTEEKLVGGPFPPPPILNRVNDGINFSVDMFVEIKHHRNHILSISLLVMKVFIVVKLKQMMAATPRIL